MALTTKTYTGTKLEPYMDPEGAVTESVVFAPSLTVTKGTVVGITTAGGKWGAYDNAASSGLEVARGIAMYDFTTDAGSLVALAGDPAVTFNSAPVYLAGTFRTTELTGLDAAGLTDLGRLVGGTLADGVIRIG